MAVTMKHMSLIVSLFGVLSFLLGVIAENKKVTVACDFVFMLLNNIENQIWYYRSKLTLKQLRIKQ